MSLGAGHDINLQAVTDTSTLSTDSFQNHTETSTGRENGVRLSFFKQRSVAYCIESEPDPAFAETTAQGAASATNKAAQSVEDLFGQTINGPDLTHTAGLQNGVLGENVALQTLNQETGLTFKPLQNSSGNGADGVVIDPSTNTIWVAEVKSSQNGVNAAASATGNPTTKLAAWVNESLDPSVGSAWQSQPAANKALAQQIQNAIDAGYQVKGVQLQVGVPAPGSTGVPQVKITPWASN